MSSSVLAAGVKIPITVRTALENLPSQQVWTSNGGPLQTGRGLEKAPSQPVWTGVPLPQGALKDTAALRLLDDAGKAVPAQFDVEARWTDGSIQWVLVSFFTSAGAGPTAQYTMVNDAAVEAPAIATPVKGDVDTNSVDVKTGPMLLRVTTHAFAGLSQVWLDVDRDGKLTSEEMITADDNHAGIFATGKDGKVYSSRLGKVSKAEMELNGPLHAVLAIHGDLRNADDREPLLEYTMRLHAFAGSSLVRAVVTVHNPHAAGRPEDGARWVLGQSGNVLIKGLEYVQPIRFAEGHRMFSMSPEPGKMLDRIPLEPVSLYQDSSGGENFFHRAHINRDNEIPISFRGYKLFYKDRQIEDGLHASPWLEVADMRWAIGVAVPNFWQNFPKSLSLDNDGMLHVGLWPRQWADLHELQGGEQKTSEFWLYFRHRRRPEAPARDGSTPASMSAAARAERRNVMPLDREMLPALLERPFVMASADAYAASGAVDPIVPRQKNQFDAYEAVVAAGVNGVSNLFKDRERADEYGWRSYGDTPANNEADQTGSPYAGLICCSHYNNEYDLGFGMMMQAMRTVNFDPKLARAWYELAIDGLWHEADIDIYHTQEDPSPIYNGGTFTHTSHGVDVGRATHRGAPTDEMWGKLDWPWAKGSTPEAGHFRNRGILTAYLITGDRHLFDAAMDVTGLVAWKITNDKFAQLEVPTRDNGNNLQILLDSYLLTGDEKYLPLAAKLVATLTREEVLKRFGADYLTKGGGQNAGWGLALYLKTLGRYIQVLQAKGLNADVAIQAHKDFSKAMLATFKPDKSWHAGTWSPLMAEVMMQAAAMEKDPAAKAEYVEAAKAAFHANDGSMGPDGVGHYNNSKSLTMLLQGGGLYMMEALKTGQDINTTQPAPAARPVRAARDQGD